MLVYCLQLLHFLLVTLLLLLARFRGASNGISASLCEVLDLAFQVPSFGLKVLNLCQ